jgi:hypothetical protein
MAESTAGEVIVVGRESPTTPKRSTRLGKLSVKAKEATRHDNETAKSARRPATRSARASSNETDQEFIPDDDTEKALLLRVLRELKSLKDASAKQQQLISDLQKHLEETQRELREAMGELRETKEELKHAREQLEVITTATTAQSSPRASYAEVARTPPGSQPSNIRSLSTANTTPSDLTDTLYCTIDVSRVEETETNATSAGAIRALIETEVRAKLSQPSWRWGAVVPDRKSPHRIRVACRDRAEHQLVKEAARVKAPRGTRVLRDELYPVKVDNVNRLAVLDQQGDYQAGVAEAFGQ